MTDDVRSTLERAYDSVRIVRRLHDVPPHEVYEVLVDGDRAVYKGDRAATGSAGVDGRVQAFVHDETSVPVSRVIQVGDDHFVAAWDDDAPPPDAATTATAEWPHATGRALATLHDETEPLVDGFGAFALVDEGARSDAIAATPRFDDWHAAVLDYIDRHRAVAAKNEHGDAVDAVREYFAANPDAFVTAGPSVCCHGWATPEHVAVEDGEVASVVDFEHAIAAPAAYDYWRTVTPTFGDADHGARRAFRDGYEAVRDLPAVEADRSVYALLNLVYYYESLFVQAHHDTHETARRARGITRAIRDLLDELE